MVWMICCLRRRRWSVCILFKPLYFIIICLFVLGSILLLLLLNIALVILFNTTHLLCSSSTADRWGLGRCAGIFVIILLFLYSTSFNVQYNVYRYVLAIFSTNIALRCGVVVGQSICAEMVCCCLL